MWNLAERGYGAAAFQSWIEEGGGWLRAGKRDIFVPGGDILKPYMTAAGGVVRGDVANIYHTLARELSATKSADLLEADTAIRNFIGGITEQQAPFGAGAGGLLGKKRKIAGSRFLTGLTKIRDFTAQTPWEVGIPEDYALKMLEDLEGKSVYSVAERAELAQQIEAGRTPGWLARHPFTSPYSFQLVDIRIMKGITEPVVSLPYFSVPVRFAGEKASNPIYLSPMVSALGDVDADAYAIGLTKPDIGKKMRQQFFQQDNEFTRAYMEHSVRTQIIKARAGTAAVEELTTQQQMIADALKLGTAQEWTPLLSTELSAARKAVVERIPGERRANALFLLQHAEQFALAGKHLGAKEMLEGRMEAFFKTIQSSLRVGSATRFEEAMMSVVDEKGLSGRLLLQGEEIAEGMKEIQKLYGVKIRNVLPPVDIRRGAQDIMSAIEMSKASGMEEMARMAAGRRAPTIENLERYLAYSGGAVGGLGANVSKAAMTSKNFLAAAGLGVLKHKKAVGFGFAGSLALAAVLSKPADLVGPGAGLIPDVKPMMRVNKAGSQMRPEDMQPPPQVLGNPSPPSRMTTPTVRIKPGQAASMDVRVRGRMDRDFARKLSAATESDRINVNVRDNSSRLSQQAIVDRILK
jgi:hypothetical protein